MIFYADRNLQQKRARFVLEEISSWRQKSWLDKAVQHAKGMPVELRAQGLMITIAKLYAKNETHTKTMADILSRWLVEYAPVCSWNNRIQAQTTTKRLFSLLQHANRREYIQAQREALALAEMIKILADAIYSQEEYQDIFPSQKELSNSQKDTELMGAFVLNRVSAWQQGDIIEKGTAKSKSLPVEIKSEGILIAFANLMRSQNKGERELAGIIASWLLKNSPLKLTAPTSEKKENLLQAFLKNCIEINDMATYQAIQDQAMKVAIYIKVYATALYDKSDQEDLPVSDEEEAINEH